jgi:hypothetical protein
MPRRPPNDHDSIHEIVMAVGGLWEAGTAGTKVPFGLGITKYLTR